jgi:hypothetical protein
MSLSLTNVRAAVDQLAAVRRGASLIRSGRAAIPEPIRHVAVRLRTSDLRLPAAVFVLVPLLLGPSAPTGALRDLLLGFLLFLVVERAIPSIAAALPSAGRSLALTPRSWPWAHGAAALAALAAAAAYGSGLLLLVLLVAACELARRLRRATFLDVASLAVGAALRVDAGALLLGGGRGALLPLLVGSCVLFLTLARVRTGTPATLGPARLVGRGALDLALLASFSLLLVLTLALTTEQGLLADRPSPWAVLGWGLFAVAGLAVLVSADRPRPRHQACARSALALASAGLAGVLLGGPLAGGS